MKPKIQTKLDEVRKQISGNSIEVGELEKFKTSINNILSELYAEKNVSKTGIKSAKRYANWLAGIVDDSLKDYEKANPTWGKLYRDANEVYGTIAQSNKVKNFIGKNLGKISPHLAYSLFGVGHGGTAKTLASLGGAAAVGLGTVETGALVTRIMKSPRLRKYYFDVLQNALKEDVVATQENLRKLEIAIDKEDHSK